MKMNATRERVMQHPCPSCHALPGQPCIGTKGQRTALHYDRWARARLYKKLAKLNIGEPT